MVCLPLTDSAGALVYSDRLRARIEQEGAVEAGPDRVTVSLGVAVYGEHGRDLQTLKRTADSALYRAKGSGRNRVELATPEPPTPVAAPPAES